MKIKAFKREERKEGMDRERNGEREEASFKGGDVKKGTESQDTERLLHP